MKSCTAFAIWMTILNITSLLNPRLLADENVAAVVWAYDGELMRPFWLGDTVDGESVLFIKDPATGEAKAQLLFPVLDVQSVTRAVDWRMPSGIKYEAGRDYVVTAGSSEITLPRD